MLEVRVRPFTLQGTVALPDAPGGVVVVANPVSRLLPDAAMQVLTAEFAARGFGVAVFDLSVPEGRKVSTPFDAQVHASRLIAVTDALAQDPRFAALPLAYLAMGAAAIPAAMAALDRPRLVRAMAIVDGVLGSAAEGVPFWAVPTLLLVGRGHASDATGASISGGVGIERHLATIPGGWPYQTDPGRLSLIVQRAYAWYTRHIAPSAAAPA